MKWYSFFLIPFALLYGVVVWCRNFLFKIKLKPTYRSPKKVISVGNLSVGGTGKTPFVAYLAKWLNTDEDVAILSRGYGRDTKGYVLANSNSSANSIGDEPLLYSKRFGKNVVVAVAEKRKVGLENLEKSFPKVSTVILDDAYQHLHVDRDVNILLTDYSKLYSSDFVLPAGRLREFKCGKNRADILIVTKCPDEISIEEKERVKGRLKFKNREQVYFSSIKYGEIKGFNGEEFQLPEKVLLVTGIANPKPLEDKLTAGFDVKTIQFPDHHNFSLADVKKIHEIFDTFVSRGGVIITTEKDYMRLCQNNFKNELKNYPWFYQTIDVTIDRELELKNYIKKIC